MDIWNSEEYGKFRKPFEERRDICEGMQFGMTDDGGFEELSEDLFSSVQRHPLPEVCRGCYKALGI